LNDRVYNVLVLCTGNSARSIMAEAIFNAIGKGRFHAFSAGSHPTGTVNPYALRQLQAVHYPVTGLRSKSWDEFGKPDTPHMDFVITVCDKAAGEVCPVWPGHPVTAHWGFEDPAAIQGSDEDKRRAFDRVFLQIAQRVRIFAELPLATLEKTAIKAEMDRIGRTPNG
jgi:arsenate reductase